MARQSKALHHREAEPDSKYNSSKVTRFINRVMKDGKKSVATTQVYIAMDILKSKLNREPLDVLEEVLQKAMPLMEVRSRRVGGAAYQVPMPVRGQRGFSLAVRWLVEESRKRPNAQYHTFGEKLAAEMMDVIKGEGGTMAKKLAMHRTADANKAFAHFRW